MISISNIATARWARTGSYWLRYLPRRVGTDLAAGPLGYACAMSCPSAMFAPNFITAYRIGRYKHGGTNVVYGGTRIRNMVQNKASVNAVNGDERTVSTSCLRAYDVLT
eukprot:1616174-Rhodomonas_salina.1